MQTSAKYRTTEDLVIDIVVYTVMIIVMIATLYPFWNILAISLNDALDSIRGGIYLWPRKFTLNNYRVILSNPDIYHATLISVLRAVIGSLTNVLSCLMVAYGISRKDYIFRKFISRVIVFTMYFSGGLIPTYLLIEKSSSCWNVLGVHFAWYGKRVQYNCDKKLYRRASSKSY